MNLMPTWKKKPRMSQERGTACICRAVAALSAALDNLTGNDDQLELAVEDLRIAGEAIGAIGGGMGVEDVLDRLFLEFCLREVIRSVILALWCFGNHLSGPSTTLE